MSDMVEPSSNRLSRLWRQLPESWRLPLVFIIPAVLVLAMMPLLFMEGGGRRGILYRDAGGPGGRGRTSANGLFEDKTQAQAPGLAAPAEAAAIPAPVSSLTKPTDGAAAFAGGPAAASAAPGAAAPEAEPGTKESELAKEAADLDGVSGDGEQSMGGPGSGAPGKFNAPRLSARQSQFSYQGGVGAGSSNSPKFRGFDFGKNAKGKGGALGGRPGSIAEAAGGSGGQITGGPADAITPMDKLKSMQSGSLKGNQDTSGSSDLAAIMSGIPGGGGGAGGGSQDGALGDLGSYMSEDMKQCNEARERLQGQITATSEELSRLQTQRHQQMDCRNIGCGYTGYNCEQWARSHKVWWQAHLLKVCRCGQIACRTISTCRRLENLNCQLGKACKQGCNSADCR